jgi:transcription antitermination factor NusG
MIIRSVDTEFYPANLWDDTFSSEPAPSDMRWWCLHTRPRQDKAVARELRESGVSYYLPQIMKEHSTPKGRRIWSVLPLFMGYVFLHGDDKDRLRALHCHRLVGVLQVFDQESLAQDLRRVHGILSSGLPLAAESHALPGTTVRIKSGPLAGFEGTVIRRGGGDHFVASVRFLSRGASVQLHDWEVEPVAGG